MRRTFGPRRILDRSRVRILDFDFNGVAPEESFGTAPLWGLGQCLFFLHDGRTSDLLEAIRAHKSGDFWTGEAPEANGVVRNFNHLRENQKQDVLNFMRSL
jgi:CxxC motif-containing protein (DUF1111 family)